MQNCMSVISCTGKFRWTQARPAPYAKRVEHKADSDDELTPEGLAGEQLKRLRIARGWSQEEVARRMSAFGVDWHQTTVGRTETAQRPLRLNEAFALAALFGVGLVGLTAPPRVDPSALSDEELVAKDAELVELIEDLGEQRREAEERMERAAADHSRWAERLAQVRMKAEIALTDIAAIAQERSRRGRRTSP